MRVTSVILFLMASLLVSCGKSPSQTAVVPGQEKEVVIPGKASEAAIESMAFFADMSEMLMKAEDEMQTDKDGTVFALCDVPVGGAICFTLINKGKGVYQVKTLEQYTGEGFEVATIELRQIDDVVMAIAFSASREPLWTLKGFESEEAYNQYRSQCYADLLTGVYKDGDGQKVVFGDDHTVTGLFGVDHKPYHQLSYMNYTSEVCHIEGTDLNFAFSPTDDGVDIFNAVEDEMSEGELMTGDELQLSLYMDGAPSVPWAHKRPVTSDFVYTFISPKQCKEATEQLKAVKKPTAVEAWNLLMLQAFESEDSGEE